MATTTMLTFKCITCGTLNEVPLADAPQDHVLPCSRCRSPQVQLLDKVHYVHHAAKPKGAKQ